MNETPNIFPQAGVPVCARCGERPGRVRVVFANGNQRAEATLCEVCAQGVKAANESKTPALDEFGRDLTAAAANGHVDPVVGRDDEIEQTAEILARRRKNNADEEHHAAVIDDAALEAAARLSDRYVTEYHLPDKAIDLIDQAAARARMHATGGEDELERMRERLAVLRAHKQAAIDAEAYEDAGRLKAEIDALYGDLEAAKAAGTSGPAVVGEVEVAAVVAGRTGIPVGELVATELQRLQQLESDLHQRVIGQDAAVEAVADTVRRARVGLSERDRPLGSFLFLGPTGVGKTELVKALAERLFATEKALVRIDMSEFREPHTVARLIGSPPGYVGYGDGGQLTEPVRRRPYSVILLDEVEKAHPEVWNVLLQLMDDGRLTDGEGRTVDFTNTVLVMTSNLGAGRARRGLGFTASEPEARDDRMLAAAKAAFLPEFVNRIDEIVTFQPLTPAQVEEIAVIVVARVGDRLRAERGIELTVEPELVSQLAQDGFDEQFGARPLQRHVRRTLEKELTRAILAGELEDGARITAGLGDDGIALRVAEPARV